MLHCKLDLKFGPFEINSTNSYKYIGSVIDKSLTLSENFNQSYKKAPSRLRLLNALRPTLDDKTSTLIYIKMVTSLLMFNSIINLNLAVTQINRLIKQRIKQKGQQIIQKSLLSMILCVNTLVRFLKRS